MELHFTKMNGAGNDFVVVDNRALHFHLTKNQIASLCDRHRGIGADGLLAVEPAESGADFRMRYYNADGGEAEMCGNGARCFARFAARIAGNQVDSLSFETPAGTIQAGILGDSVRLAMSRPVDYAPAVTLTAGDLSFQTTFINTGVPHAVVPVDSIDSVDVKQAGSAIRHHDHFAPKGTNVNFVAVESKEQIQIRTYERGVEDETLACGTGVVASALCHHIRTGAVSPVSVRVRGGDTLTVAFTPTATCGEFSDVTLTGPADFVFDGTIQID